MPLRREPSPRYKIKVLSKQLRKLTFPTSPISVKLATFAADAFDKFISGEFHSLDEAFGITKDRGAPRNLSVAKKKLAIARKIFALRLAGKTWYQIENEMGVDQRALRRDYAPFTIRLMRRKVNLDLPARAIPKSTHTNEQQLSEKERWTAWKKQNDKD